MLCIYIFGSSFRNDCVFWLSFCQWDRREYEYLSFIIFIFEYLILFNRNDLFVCMCLRRVQFMYVFKKSSIHERLECLTVSMLFGISLGLYCDTRRVKTILAK